MLAYSGIYITIKDYEGETHNRNLTNVIKNEFYLLMWKLDWIQQVVMMKDLNPLGI